MHIGESGSPHIGAALSARPRDSFEASEAITIAIVTTAIFGFYAARVATRTTTGEADAMKPEKALFKYSILYLFVIFGALVVDHWIRA